MELHVEEVITELSKIDNVSERVILSAEDDRKSYSSDMDKKKKDFELSLTKKLNEELSKLKTELECNNNKTLNDLNNNIENELTLLDKSYNENHDIWASDIFNKLTKE